MLSRDSDRPYVRKFRRAMKHFDDVKGELDRYEASNPYGATRDSDTDTNPRIWTFIAELAEKPHDDLPLIVSDFFHNLRACLDYAAVALVPRQRKRKTRFPIERQDIWAVDPESGDYLDAGPHAESRRASFQSAVKGMPEDAAAFIRRLQPYNYTGPGTPDHHRLAVLSALDNAEKHFDIRPVVLGITDPTTALKTDRFKLTYPGEGTVLEGGVVACFRIYPSDLKAKGITDPALLELVLSTLSDPNAEVDVEVSGSIEVGIEIPGIAPGYFVLRQIGENLSETVWNVLCLLDAYVEAADEGIDMPRVLWP